MPQLLTLRGRHALSPFRVAKLHAALAVARPRNAVSSVSTEYWHFVETDRPLEPGERQTLDRLLTYGSPDARAGGAHDPRALEGSDERVEGHDDGQLFVVVPPPG